MKLYKVTFIVTKEEAGLPPKALATIACADKWLSTFGGGQFIMIADDFDDIKLQMQLLFNSETLLDFCAEEITSCEDKQFQYWSNTIIRTLNRKDTDA